MAKKTKQITDASAKQLVELIGEPDLALFFLAWVKHGLNATKAYQELHPDVGYQSATVLGSRALGKVNKEAVLAVYDLGPDRYFKQLSAGLAATKLTPQIVGRDPK